MNWSDWYTDAADVWRNEEEKDGALSYQKRKLVLKGAPCRIYKSDSKAPNMTQTASNVRQEDKLMCDISADIRAGDELIISRGGQICKDGPTIRAFAGEPSLYYEPFGAAALGLGHMEVTLSRQEIIK